MSYILILQKGKYFACLLIVMPPGGRYTTCPHIAETQKIHFDHHNDMVSVRFKELLLPASLAMSCSLYSSQIYCFNQQAWEFYQAELLKQWIYDTCSCKKQLTVWIELQKIKIQAIKQEVMIQSSFPFILKYFQKDTFCDRNKSNSPT